jgi:aryl-alcohol dehydrogenase-like predicted oxidoreductase
MVFGAMRLTGKGVWGLPADRMEAIRVLRRAVELGVNFIDTADSYGPKVAEELIAEALHPYPVGLVIATKAGFAGRWRWTTPTAEALTKQYLEVLHDLRTSNNVVMIVPTEGGMPALDIGELRRNLK